MRTMPAIALAVLLLLSGCASTGGKERDDDQEPPEGTLTSTATGSASGSGTSTPSATRTGTGTPGANRAPTGGIDAVVNGTLVTFGLTGADPDGDALAWTLDFGEGNRTEGTELPATVNHTFAPGNHTVVYGLTDGKATSPYNVTFNVTVAGNAAPIQTVRGSWVVGAFGCGAQYDPFPANLREGSGTGFFSIDVDPATIGRPYAMVMTWDATAAALGGDISFYDAQGAFVDGNLVTGSSPLAFTGVVPTGASFAVTTVCDAPGAEIAYAA